MSIRCIDQRRHYDIWILDCVNIHRYINMPSNIWRIKLKCWIFIYWWWPVICWGSPDSYLSLLARAMLSRFRWNVAPFSSDILFHSFVPLHQASLLLLLLISLHFLRVNWQLNWRECPRSPFLYCIFLVPHCTIIHNLYVINCVQLMLVVVGGGGGGGGVVELDATISKNNAKPCRPSTLNSNFRKYSITCSMRLREPD